MSDIRNMYGDVVFRLESNRIFDIYGNWLYTIVGNRINNTAGQWLYEIRNEYLYDTYGNRVGEMSKLADILPSKNKNISSSGSNTTKKEDSGCLGMFFGYLFWMVSANWGGRIGVILGIICTIYVIKTEQVPPSNGILVGIIVIFLFGTIGAYSGKRFKKDITEKSSGIKYQSPQSPQVYSSSINVSQKVNDGGVTICGKCSSRVSSVDIECHHCGARFS